MHSSDSNFETTNTRPSAEPKLSCRMVLTELNQNKMSKYGEKAGLAANCCLHIIYFIRGRTFAITIRIIMSKFNISVIVLGEKY